MKKKKYWGKGAEIEENAGLNRSCSESSRKNSAVQPAMGFILRLPDHGKVYVRRLIVAPRAER